MGDTFEHALKEVVCWATWAKAAQKLLMGQWDRTMFAYTGSEIVLV